MDYGKILKRSADIVWQNKFLILLGFLAALGGGSFGGSSGVRDVDRPFGEPGQFTEFGDAIAGLALGLIIALVCVAVIVGIALWIVSTIARGGVIAGVDTIESDKKSSFSQAWRAGRDKIWTLLGIGLLPAIPGLILFVVGLLGLTAYGSIFALFGKEFADPLGTTGLGISIALAACIVVPIVLVLSILRNFAERACMLEDLGVIAAYRRGTSVLMANLGEAIILFLLQIAASIVLGVLLFLPGLALVLCCILWPLLLVVQGAISAIISAIWTLAWRTWTPMVEEAPAAV